MSRFDLIAQLKSYRIRHPSDQFVDPMLVFIQSQENCFERDCFDDGHITGSSWVFSPDFSSVLLTHHRKLGMWIQLGGHSDGESNTLAVALREAHEESGLQIKPLSEDIFDIDIHVIPAHKSDPTHKHYDVRFAFLVEGSTQFQVSDESNALQWVRLDEVSELTHERSILRMVERSGNFLASVKEP